jgi:hypothetical protein
MQPEHGSETRTLDLADISRLALLEIVDCQPFVVGLMARGYDWVPSSLPPCLGVAFPWTRHYRNPYILPDSLSRLVSGCVCAQRCVPTGLVVGWWGD